MLRSLVLLAFAALSIAARPVDPLRSYMFRLLLDGRPVAGAARVGVPAPSRVFPAIGQRRTPRAVSRQISLLSGIVVDTPFGTWASGAAALPHDLVLQRLNLKGEVVSTTAYSRCTAQDFEGLPDLDAQGNQLAFTTLTLNCRG